MAPRTLAAPGLAAVLCCACFVDENRGASSETTASTGDAGPTDVLPVSTGSTTAPETGTTTGTTSGPTQTQGPGDTGDVTTGTATTGPTPVCPSAASFPGLGPDPACAECLGTQCCATVRECADDPACTEAWSCMAAEPCPNNWAACPGHARSKPRLDAISGCISGPCAAVCTSGVCAAETAKCSANPACGAVADCVQAECADIVCPPEDPGCILVCWDQCAQKNPGGGEDWSALLNCLGSQCE
jgi:hypothetical protein